MKDPGLKAVSLAMAIGLSLFVHSESNTSEISFVVPVEIKNPPKDRIILSRALQAEVKVRGPSFLLARVSASPPGFKLTIPRDAPERLRMALRADQLGLPPSVRVVRIEPSEIDLNFDKSLEKTLKVEIPTLGSVPRGYRLESIKALPEIVEITGAESELKDITAIETLPLDLREMTSPQSSELSLRVPGKFSEIRPQRILVEVNVRAEEGTSHLSAIPVAMRPPLPTHHVMPATVELEVSGQPHILDKLKSSDVSAYVVPSGRIDNGSEVEVKVVLPADIRLVAVEPTKVRLVPLKAGK